MASTDLQLLVAQGYDASGCPGALLLLRCLLALLARLAAGAAHIRILATEIFYFLHQQSEHLQCRDGARLAPKLAHSVQQVYQTQRRAPGVSTVGRIRYASLLQENEARQCERLGQRGWNVCRCSSLRCRGFKVFKTTKCKLTTVRPTGNQRPAHKLPNSPSRASSLEYGIIARFPWARRTAPWLTGSALGSDPRPLFDAPRQRPPQAAAAMCLWR